jgi:5-methylcytosine-specific restriction protein B
MANYSQNDTSTIYEAAQPFRANCLLREDSQPLKVFSVWLSDFLELIGQAFVAAPDQRDRTLIKDF